MTERGGGVGGGGINIDVIIGIFFILGLNSVSSVVMG